MKEVDFKNIYNTYHEGLIRYINGKVADPLQAEDICQDVFLKIQSNLDKLNDEANIEPWIFKIAKFTVIDFYRSKKTEPLPNIIKSEVHIEKDIVAAQGLDGIKTIIETLPDKYATVLKLFKLQKLTAREITIKTGLSLSAVKSRLLRGKAMFNKKLKACCDVQLNKNGDILDINCTDKFPRIKNKK
ncbi:MAG: sigma-70 family RNA polymerase sigma factor [Deltaproteobacteria bacterium]|nr:sigma-70 family RNA polymerase sigma factor [Candidatus Desulfobacula maris]